MGNAGATLLGMLPTLIAVGTALFYTMASLNTYAMLAWMPTIFQSFDLDEGTAATAFSVFTFLTLPMAAISPIIGSKMRNPFPYAAALTILPAIGFLGMFLVPGLPWVWAAMTGLIGGAFPLAIAMFNKRTRTQQGSGALSGFAMGVGYLAGVRPAAGRLADLSLRQLDAAADHLRDHVRADARRRVDDEQAGPVPGGPDRRGEPGHRLTGGPGPAQPWRVSVDDDEDGRMRPVGVLPGAAERARRADERAVGLRVVLLREHPDDLRGVDPLGRAVAAATDVDR